MRPAEVDVLRGDSTKAMNELGWKPKTKFSDMVKKMVKNDITKLKK
jgi:GDPmannose 4,6-dehydratase